MNIKYITSLFFALFLLPFSSTQAANQHKNNSSEGKIIKTMIVLNKNEIGAGDLANKKSSNAKVKKFAAFMIKEHTSNLKQAELLEQQFQNKNIISHEALNLKHKGKKELTNLKKLNGTAFDKAYITAMVKGHMDALNLINSLLVESSDPQVKKYLIQTKKHVQLHLEKAKAVQKSLK